MLVLNEQNIRQAIGMSEVIDAVDDAYRCYENNTYQMPTRAHVQHGENTYLMMPCFTDEYLSNKLVTVYPDNKDTPVIQGVVLLNDGRNGTPLAMMNGAYMTGIRTGAIGGSAIRHLSKQEASSAALIGTGVQGYFQLLAACAERTLTDIYLFNRSAEKVPAFIGRLQEALGKDIAIHHAKTTEEAIRQADIIITATSSNEPVLPDDASLLEGKLIVGIGSFQPSMQEFPKAAYDICPSIYIDSEDAIHESGDLITPLSAGWLSKDSIIPFSKIVTGELMHPENQDTILFKSTGMALFDAFVARNVYEAARERNIGDSVDL
ncbi:ornithine cyclodeaminase family protein [Thalassobacillus hwangdonensis]|uniref:Ornithine cyclodeaminase family protein n=1 Tax=Thalassobacillus hwangdonensis TaxID=546108 RepID=A0ABW3L155_9BACI